MPRTPRCWHAWMLEGQRCHCGFVRGERESTPAMDSSVSASACEVCSDVGRATYRDTSTRLATYTILPCHVCKPDAFAVATRATVGGDLPAHAVALPPTQVVPGDFDVLCECGHGVWNHRHLMPHECTEASRDVSCSCLGFVPSRLAGSAGVEVLRPALASLLLAREEKRITPAQFTRAIRGLLAPALPCVPAASPEGTAR
jgi:hypothetical protein